MSQARRRAHPTRVLLLAARMASRRRSSLATPALLVVVGLALCATLAVSALGALRTLDAALTIANAQSRAAALESLLENGGAPRLTTLVTMQRDARAVAADCAHADADLAALGAGAPDSGVSAPLPALAGCADLAAAGADAIAALRIALPHLGSLAARIAGASSVSSSAARPAWTASDVSRVAARLASAIRLLRQVGGPDLATLADTLRALGAPRLASDVTALAQISARLPAALSDSLVVTRMLSGLLGAQRPERLLLLLLDSDELRPTGGFIGNYALLTVRGGMPAAPLKLRDIYSLDCPGACPFRAIPSRYSWMTADPLHFALRDSNLDPDYPSSARFAELLYSQEGGGQTQGVISITSALIEDALRVIGPVGVPGYGVTVTANNLTEMIHYYHLLNHLGARKAFDAALATALMGAAATLEPSQVLGLALATLRALGDGAIQMYFNDSRLEGLLAAFALDGAVRTPQGDSLFVVDTNLCCTYANEDVAESLSDVITLNAAGDAQHDLTIRYSYPVVSHLWSTLWTTQGGRWLYIDYLRAITPASARWLGWQGTLACAPRADSEAGHTAHGCTLQLPRGGAITLHLRWVTPHAAQLNAHGHTALYTLLIQHQVGAHTQLSVTIVAPPHGAVRQAGATLGDVTTTRTTLRYTASPTRDVTLALAYTLP